MKNNEYKILSALVYYLTEEEVQGVADQVIDRYLTSDEIEELKFKICDEITWVLQEAIQAVADFTDLEQRGIGEEKVHPRYEIHARNDNAYQSDFTFINAFKDEEDARYYTQKRYIYPAEEYKIEEINGDVRKIIVHHRNSLNGGDGFHMDVHDEPKVPQNVVDETF